MAEMTEVIDEIIKEFDFAMVHEVMVFTKWKWGEVNPKIPTVDRLKARARDLLERVSHEPDGISISTGGFKATKKGGSFLQLEFVIERVLFCKEWIEGKKKDG